MTLIRVQALRLPFHRLNRRLILLRRPLLLLCSSVDAAVAVAAVIPARKAQNRLSLLGRARVFRFLIPQTGGDNLPRPICVLQSGLWR